jgi:hypothetical protein
MSERTELRFLGHLLMQPGHSDTARMFSELCFCDEIHRSIFRCIVARGADAAFFEFAGVPAIGKAVRLAIEFPVGRDMVED